MKKLFSNPEIDKILVFLRLLLFFETSYQKKLSIWFWPLDLWRFCKRPLVKIFKNVGGDRVWVLKIYPKIRVGRHLNLGMVRLGWVIFFWKLQSLWLKGGEMTFCHEVCMKLPLWEQKTWKNSIFANLWLWMGGGLRLKSGNILF